MSAIDLYAVLGVARDASTDEIRAAWKRAVADLEPTDPSLNVFNQAGAVLLDADRRAAYDAEVAAEEVGSDAGRRDSGSTAGGPSVHQPPARSPRAPASPATTGGSAAAPAPAAEETGPREISTVLLAVVGLLALAAVLAAIFAAGPLGRALPDRGVPAEQVRLADAVSAAEKAAVPVLSYDYRHLAEDKKAASAHLTSGFLKDYEQTFTLIEQNAPATQAVVAVKVVASAVAGSSSKGVDVLLFVDRPTTKKGSKEPDVFRDQVTFSMRRVHGTWLVDDMRTRRPA